MTYEIVGSKEKAVAIIGYGVKNPRLLAKKIMKTHKNVKSVILKTGERTGEYRVHSCKLLLGDKNTEVVHRENGYVIKVDPRKVYFSSKEATERKRIADLVGPGEKILVMFSGASPYAIAIKKKHSDTKITCIEINPWAVGYANKNMKLNKLKGIRNICADVRRVKLGKFDRIIMPLPETALQYIDSAYNFSKIGTIIHLYTFAKDFENAIEEIEDECEMYNIHFKIIGKQKVLPYGPGIWKLRIDLKY